MKLFFFNSREVYTGYSREDAMRIIDALKQEGIASRYKSDTRGFSLRGRSGMGMNQDYTTMHYVLVHENDFDRAEHLINQVLRSDR